jgi:hypothetical protein
LSLRNDSRTFVGMIEKAYIQEYGNGRMEPEHQGIRRILESRNIPVILFTQKKLDRRKLDLSPECLVAGETSVITKALKQLYVEPPPPNTYPEALQHLLKRKIWQSTLKEVLYDLDSNPFHTGVFVKPKDTAKKFTGCVLNSLSDTYLLKGASLQTPVFCAETVYWLTEYRVFVVNSQIAGIKHYWGDEGIPLNLNEVEEAIKHFETSPERTNGYGIDFDVLQNGETALIEWNDGYALGSYKLDDELYTNLIIARWEEMMLNINPPKI